VIKLTKQRQIVYDVLKNSSTPLNAEMVFNLIPNNSIDLSTIYRSISYLEKNNMILRFHFTGKSFYILNTKSHHHYFVCTNCLTFKPISCILDGTIDHLKEKHKFLVTNHEITIYGLCEKCQH